MDGSVNVPGASAADLAAVRQIAENAETAANAAAAVQGNLDTHIGDTTKHITAAERTAWNGKQNALTFDDVPTSGSNNPVNSDGIAAALAAVSDDIANKVNTEDVAELWVWEKTLYTPQSYELGEVIERVVLAAGSSHTYGRYYDYADAIHANVNGSIKLINPTSATVTYNDNYASVLLGKYIKTFSSTPDNKLSANAVYYIPADCSLNSSKDVVANGNTYTYGVTASKVQRVIGAAEIITHVSYLTSLDSEAYLEDGQSGGYWYTRLGQIGDGMTKHEIGSYVGTGTYGESTPNSLTFEFVPKAFLITVPTGGYYAYPSPNPVLFIMGADTISLDGFAGNQNDTITVIWNGKTVSWYSTKENPQLNCAGATYHYVVFG